MIVMWDMSTPGPDVTVSDAELRAAIARRDVPFATAGDVADDVGLSRYQTSKRLDVLADADEIKRGVVGKRVKIYWLELE